MERRIRLAVVGAGPVGLEAAAVAVESGWEVRVFEAARVGEHVGRWGHVALFTPFGMNAGAAGRRLLAGAGVEIAGDAAMQTGEELREGYLLPLAERLASRPRCEIREGCRVLSVGRSRYGKGDLIGDPARARDPFRILVEEDGREALFVADVLLDCSGTFGTPRWSGPGGGPALGERRLRERIDHTLPDVDGRERERFAGRRTLVVGDGHSAATAIVELERVAREVSDTSFLWVTRLEGERPIEPIVDDAIPGRERLVGAANGIAAAPPPGSRWVAPASVLAFEEGPGGRVTVHLRNGSGADLEPLQVDNVLALVGYEPDDSIYRELQIHECYASRAPMKLAAALLTTRSDGPADCLDVGELDAATLLNPEPNYFILGMKSYGRNSEFLLRTGYAQIVDAVGLIERAAT